VQPPTSHPPTSTGASNHCRNRDCFLAYRLASSRSLCENARGCAQHLASSHGSDNNSNGVNKLTLCKHLWSGSPGAPLRAARPVCRTMGRPGVILSTEPQYGRQKSFPFQRQLTVCVGACLLRAACGRACVRLSEETGHKSTGDWRLMMKQ